MLQIEWLTDPPTTACTAVGTHPLPDNYNRDRDDWTSFLKERKNPQECSKGDKINKFGKRKKEKGEKRGQKERNIEKWTQRRKE